MKDLVNLYNKSFSDSSITEEDILKAGKDVYHILRMHAMISGENWRKEPEAICRITYPVIKDIDYIDYLKKDFKKKTGMDWNPREHVLAILPPMYEGGAEFIVFKK